MATAAVERIHEQKHEEQERKEGCGSDRRGSWTAAATGKSADRKNNSNVELPRAASYTYIPDAKEKHFGSHAVLEIKGFTEGDYASQMSELDDVSPSNTSTPESSGWTTPEGADLPAVPPPQIRDIVAHLRKSTATPQTGQNGQSTRSSVGSSSRKSGNSLESARTTSTSTTTPVSRPSINKSFSRTFSRNSWYQSTMSSPSRSPSPAKSDGPMRSQSFGADALSSESLPDGRRKSLISRTLTVKSLKGGKTKDAAQSSEDMESDRPKRKGTILRKKAVRAASGITKINTSHWTAGSDVPAVPALPKSFSTDRLPSLKPPSAMSIDRAAPVPRLISPLKSHNNSSLSVTRKKDELWSVFRALDADFSKFSSKSTALKANVVRTSLVPFLRSCATHPSNRNLRPEDLDRRANILNKWWTGMIELLHGRNNQSISGTDRPVILDAISGIMERPEWRLSPSPFCPLSQRINVALSNGNRSNISLGSSSSDFLADSVHHNVRNIFVQNLSAQMAFVVEKMSLRNASASLVSFCGKACAYAFVFVPGMADVLARLWVVPMDTMRRVLQENGIGKFDQLSGMASGITADFPPALQRLGFTSLMKYVRQLRTPPPLPLGTNHVQWWGHWVERWSGRESDLFYVFVKYFHILATDFLPSNASNEERMCAPGMLLVQSQMLTNLDATIHRDVSSATQDSSAGTPSSTFDEMLSDPDAIASALPIPPTNSLRLMAENRLVMLIRDFLSERTTEHPEARELFAKSFNLLLQTAVRGTSVFDHSASYTLLDFLEEALLIVTRFEQLRDDDEAIMDSVFWQTVFRRMIESENTMTEIRLYSFLFTIWNTVVRDRKRKTNLCMDLLLDPVVFESRFNHWCPMVRAYFMRLLCWRIGRHDGEESTDDLQVLEALQERLQITWTHYLYLRNEAEIDQRLCPDTSPCHPAPGRRLLIVRTDNQVDLRGSFMTFDGLLKDVPPGLKRPAQQMRPSSTQTLLETLDSRPSSRPDSSASSTVDSETDTRDKGIGGFLRRVIGGTRTRSKSQGPKDKPVKKEVAPPVPMSRPAPQRAATAEPVTLHNVAPTTEAVTSSRPPPVPVPQHRSLSFKFSLEVHPSGKQYPPMRLTSPRLPPPAHNYLQTHSKQALSSEPLEPSRQSIASARYSGRALAEWAVVVGECHSFFERRKKEGVPENRLVETPTLAVEVFKRPS